MVLVVTSNILLRSDVRKERRYGGRASRAAQDGSHLPCSDRRIDLVEHRLDIAHVVVRREAKACLKDRLVLPSPLLGDVPTIVIGMKLGLVTHELVDLDQMHVIQVRDHGEGDGQWESEPTFALVCVDPIDAAHGPLEIVALSGARRRTDQVLRRCVPPVEADQHRSKAARIDQRLDQRLEAVTVAHDRTQQVLATQFLEKGQQRLPQRGLPTPYIVEGAVALRLVDDPLGRLPAQCVQPLTPSQLFQDPSILTPLPAGRTAQITGFRAPQSNLAHEHVSVGAMRREIPAQLGGCHAPVSGTSEDPRQDVAQNELRR